MTTTIPTNPESLNGTRPTPVVEAVDLCVGYGAIPVIRNLNLALYPGEVVALLGANGAGKTTSLLALSGELPPQSGKLLWNGHRTKAPLHKRARLGLGFLTEEKSVFMRLTVAENLRLGRGDPDRALELMPELVPLMKRRAGLLSGGEQQILSLGRALAADSRLLLLDEISLGLAPIIVKRLLRVVREAADKRNVAVLLVEQHVSIAMQFSDRAIVLRHGQVALEGNSSDLAGRVEEITDLYL